MPSSTAPLTSAFRAEQLTQAIAAGAAQVPFPRATDRAAWSGIDSASRAEILTHAEALVTEPWPVLTLTQRLAFERTGSRRAFEAPYFDRRDRKSTRLNSSHVAISYAVFCVKKEINNY